MLRRQFLAFSGAAFLPTVAGCGDDFDPVESKQQLGSAEPIAFEVEPDRDYEYVETSHEVRFTWSGETRPMDEWGSTRAAEHAADIVHASLDEAGVVGEMVAVSGGEVDLTSLDEWRGTDRPTEAEFERSHQRGVVVRHHYHYERDGSLSQEPAVAFERLVEVTPRAVDVTIHFPEYDHHAQLPVRCNRMWIRNE